MMDEHHYFSYEKLFLKSRLTQYIPKKSMLAQNKYQNIFYRRYNCKFNVFFYTKNAINIFCSESKPHGSKQTLGLFSNISHRYARCQYYNIDR